MAKFASCPHCGGGQPLKGDESLVTRSCLDCRRPFPEWFLLAFGNPLPAPGQDDHLKGRWANYYPRPPLYYFAPPHPDPDSPVPDHVV